MIHTAGILIRQGKAYVPVYAQTEMGVYMHAEPVFVTNLTVEELTAALEQVVAIGHPGIPHPTQEEWRRWRSPVLKVAGVRSWKEMAQGGVSYGISWSDKETKLYISHVEDPAQWRRAPVMERVFPKDTSLRTLVEAILEDVGSHPELLAGGET